MNKLKNLSTTTVRNNITCRKAAIAISDKVTDSLQPSIDSEYLLGHQLLYTLFLHFPIPDYAKLLKESLVHKEKYTYICNASVYRQQTKL